MKRKTKVHYLPPKLFAEWKRARDRMRKLMPLFRSYVKYLKKCAKAQIKGDELAKVAWTKKAELNYRDFIECAICFGSKAKDAERLFDVLVNSYLSDLIVREGRNWK